MKGDKNFFKDWCLNKINWRMRYWLFEMITNPMILYSVVNHFYLFSLFDSLFFKYRDISLTLMFLPVLRRRSICMWWPVPYWDWVIPWDIILVILWNQRLCHDVEVLVEEESNNEFTSRGSIALFAFRDTPFSSSSGVTWPSQPKTASSENKQITLNWRRLMPSGLCQEGRK